MIKFQLSQALTSHFQSFWSIVHSVEKPKSLTFSLHFSGLPEAISNNYISIGTPFSDARNVTLSPTFE